MRLKLLFFFLFVTLFSKGQNNLKSFVDVNYFKGNIALHNNSILHLIKGHPEGVVIAWNKKTFGEKEWEQRYNYPDYGFSFSYQNLKNDVLGNNYAFFGHYNFYFFNRNLIFRIAQGIGFNTNPYDKESNHKNVAFGSTFLSSTYVMLNYKKEHVYDKFGIQAGLTMTHYSNGNFKAPNTSVNSIALNVGINYNLDAELPSYIKAINNDSFSQPVKFNFVLRGGINESDVIGSGQYPFAVVSAYADKRLSYKSALQLGVDAFFSKFLEELIYYKSVAFPEEDVSGDEDYRRVGAFIGHELFVNKLSVLTQVGYYVYCPFDFEGRTYFRAGLKYYMTNKLFAALTLKSHGAKAEAIEFGIGVRM
ncbi:acyloxyacyl hydrolase [Mangrovimonas aestuarii]|uniref:acyloxyacyl hydrolase n=1 Tax=Mangrovimonas aestuarii TaxID=3018443 RepID=UPI002378C91F|nr:acyloxyacyl hydrolase [Mangrovimonas aestuarii]